MKIADVSRRLALGIVALPLLAGGCKDDPIGPEDVTYAPELGVDLDRMRRLPTGVYVETLTVGFGSRTVEAGDSVEVSYTLWLPNGTEIDSGELSRNLGSLIPGFQDGVIGMVKGEIRLIVVPPERGYGANPPSGSGIPPRSVLVFRVELLDIPSIQ